jgi:hypothetical protein
VRLPGGLPAGVVALTRREYLGDVLLGPVAQRLERAEAEDAFFGA